ncbi:hypothetical protein Sa4125_47350 (plasmid) [Aureimonas sp. SA4125]|nr:hypothetical protein Sa4125_47350 [Aureimonas sp. SA4125]
MKEQVAGRNGAARKGDKLPALGIGAAKVGTIERLSVDFHPELTRVFHRELTRL